MASTRRQLRLAGYALLALGMAACDETLLDAGPTETGAPTLVAVEGQQLLTQLGLPGTTPIRIRVLDGAGQPIRSATVRYQLLTGRGAFSSLSTVTGDQGFTEVAFRPLEPGTAVVEARTARPNGTGRVEISVVVLADPREATAFIGIDGDGQTGPVGSELPKPFVVRVLNADGLAVSGHPVTFEASVVQGSGAGVSAVRDGPASGQVLVMTDGSGSARAFLKLGDTVGPHAVTATTLLGPVGAQSTQSVTFSANATSLPADRLVIVAGQGQTAVIDTLNAPGSPEFAGRDPNPFVVRALDPFGHPVAGTAISWIVSDGGGFMSAATTFTDADGLAEGRLRGVTEGRNAVVALTAGTSTAEFVVTGVVYTPPAEDGGG